MRTPIHHGVDLAWDTASETVSCGRTGTRVRLHVEGAVVRHAVVDALDLASESQALTVRATAGSFSEAIFTEDLRALLALINAPSGHLELSMHVGDGESTSRGEIRATDAAHTESYVMTYRVIQRNDVVLRVALLSRVEPGRVHASLLAGIDDSPGFDLHGGLRREPRPGDNSVWQVLLLMRDIDRFLNPTRSRPRGYDVPPTVPGT